MAGWSSAPPWTWTGKSWPRMPCSTSLAELAAQSEDGLGHNVNNAALVALDPHNGEILALVGSPDYFDAAAQRSDQHGAGPTPARLGDQAAGLCRCPRPDPPGGGWTAATMLLDVSTSFVTHEGKAYTPANYDLREHGPVLVREALASSLNIPAVHDA